MGKMAIDISVKIANLVFKNPIMPASGTFGYGLEFAPFYDISELGAIVTKSISLEPKHGAPPPRIAEVEGGMINAIGLENPGINYFYDEIFPELRKYDTLIILSIFGSSIDEFLKIIEIIHKKGGIDAIELNISCPNVEEGGLLFGTNADLTFRLVQKIKNSTRLPLIVKLTPNDCNIVEIAKVTENAGADALSLINTMLGLSIDINKKKSRIGFGFGGLSGPCIKPVALRMVHQVSKNVSIPIIGIGGIKSLHDVIEFLIAGATAIQIGTHNFIDPSICHKIIEELPRFLAEHKISSLSEIIGSLTFDKK